ncbi:uncharacterized protein A4U43_C02F21340 [Asparagus officinalis]|uniref:Poly [ADP-ribose] polymerase n=1 Tax=Asparagus officinalis TaxID=4686 RepID=A0A5P1FKM8_ASPOF|nr:uncharacterized protein A4U43_C02F21340 [Asparagus officinalis]
MFYFYYILIPRPYFHLVSAKFCVTRAQAHSAVSFLEKIHFYFGFTLFRKTLIKPPLVHLAPREEERALIMASKLKVDELRSQLKLRGLDDTGTKPILVKRLESAIQQEEEKEKESAKDVANGTKKRERDSKRTLEAEEDSSKTGTPNGRSKRSRDALDEKREEIISIEKLQKIGVRQLRELAARRGLLQTGTKKELIERLSVDMDKDSEENHEAKGAEECKEEKLITATKKGGAVLDQWLPDDIKSSFHVLQWGQEIYDATLNQTNVGENNNKFYVIQALGLVPNPRVPLGKRSSGALGVLSEVHGDDKGEDLEGSWIVPDLQSGLRIAPPEAPSTGYMFGKGVYFADMFSKSANYCFASKECSTGVLLLCEVALGGMAEQLAANYNADRLPEGKLSTKGVGVTAPDMSKAKSLRDGVVVPLGKPKENTEKQGSLLYNEYIVYNVEQIRMRYIVQVNFKWK